MLSKNGSLTVQSFEYYSHPDDHTRQTLLFFFILVQSKYVGTGHADTTKL